MNIRCGFVSNSSSCAFIVYGRKLSEDEVRLMLQAVHDFYMERPDDRDYDYYTKDFDIDELMDEPYMVEEYLDMLGVTSSDEYTCGESSYFIGSGRYIDYMEEFDPNILKKEYEESQDKLKNQFGIELPAAEPSLYAYRVGV